MDDILVYEWKYITNWPYVVMSRVKTMNGLHIREPLDEFDLTKYAVPEELKRKLLAFKALEPEYVDETEYDDIATNLHITTS